MRRASPLVRIDAFDKAAVASAESAPAETAAISLSESTVSWSGGFATPVNAVLPDKNDYQRLKFVVAPVGAGITGAPTAVEVTIWERTADGVMVNAGVAELQADGTFTDVEVDNHPARYYATVSTITGGTSPEVTVGVWVQGTYAPTYIATDGT
jgi:hypothetical protein